MASTRSAKVAAGVAACLLGALSGCGGSGDGDEGNSGAGATADTTVDATPRALAALTIEHMGVDPSAAAPLFPRDGVPAHSLGVEVAFPIDDSSVHIQTVVSPRTQLWSRLGCDSPENSVAAGCEDLETDDGAPMRLTWENEAPEEDPGFVQVWVLRDGWITSVFMSGALVHGDPREGGLTFDYAHMEAIAADPATGLVTTQEQVDAGEDISDDVWLDWYGQGNGSPPPAGFEPTEG